MQLRKQTEYNDPREVVKVADHHCHLWTVQVGLRGIIDKSSFSASCRPYVAVQSKMKQTYTYNWQGHFYRNPSQFGALGTN